MSFKCFKCEVFCEVMGIGAFAILIADDPESSVALVAIKQVYRIFTKMYRHHMSEKDFIRNTKNLAGELTDLEFIAIYPHRVCHWFGRC